MNRNAVGFAVAALCAVLAGSCRDSTAPQVTVVLSQLSRHSSLDISAADLNLDSVTLTLSGSAATQGRWTVTHGAAPWIWIGTTSGVGNGVVRWARDPSNLGFGTWVDTISITVEGAGGVVRLIDSLVIGGAQPTFVTSRRAWRPGERDSAIAYVNNTQAAGEFSFALAQLFAITDSITQVVRNPALMASAQTGGPVPRRLGQAAGGTWTLVAMQIRELFPIAPGSATMDSLKWLGLFWYASADSTWKGRVIAGTSASTIGKTTVNTTSFDASGAKTGAGGGESRTSVGNYWEASSGKIWVTSNACSPSSCANNTFTSGPWLGGQWHGILMGGQLISILAPCVLPVGCTTVDTFNINFGTGPVGPTAGLYINCVFPSPCTGAAAAALAELGRRRATLRQVLTGELFAGDKRGAGLMPRWPSILP